MAKVKVEVLDAIVGNKKKGEQLELEQSQAEYLQRIGYVKVLDEPKRAEEKSQPKKEEPQPKKPVSRKKSSSKSE